MSGPQPSSGTLMEALRSKLKLNQPFRGLAFHSISERALAAEAERRGLTLREIMIHALNEGFWPERFRAQRGSYTAADQARILSSTVAVIGAGGLGGTVCLLLARVGVGRLVVCDGDGFDESNLNRQMLSRTARLGMNKARAAAEEIRMFNSAVTVEAWPVMATPENLPAILGSAQVVVDCLDNQPTRYQVQTAARTKGIPFVHGAVAGTEGLVMVIFPQGPGLEALYGPEPAAKADSAESLLGVPTVTPAVTAGLQVSATIDLLLGHPVPPGRLRHLDLSVPCIEIGELT